MLLEGLQSASIVRHKRPDHRQASQGKHHHYPKRNQTPVAHSLRRISCHHAKECQGNG